MAKHSPVEAKTIASTGAAAGGTVISAFIVWLLAVTVWGADWHDVDLDTLTVVPGVVTAVIGITVIPGLTHLAGWLTHHTSRPEPQPASELSEPVPLAELIAAHAPQQFGPLDQP